MPMPVTLFRFVPLDIALAGLTVFCTTCGWAPATPQNDGNTFAGGGGGGCQNHKTWLFTVPETILA